MTPTKHEHFRQRLALHKELAEVRAMRSTLDDVAEKKETALPIDDLRALVRALDAARTDILARLGEVERVSTDLLVRVEKLEKKEVKASALAVRRGQ